MARFRLVRQHDGMQCGVACVSMICQYFGKKIPIAELESNCHPSKDGVSLKAIYDLCEVIGLDSVAGKMTLRGISRNIAVDDEEIDVDRLVRSAKIACIYDYIISLPLKFDTKIGLEGVGLSQGQKQRILIARCVQESRFHLP